MMTSKLESVYVQHVLVPFDTTHDVKHAWITVNMSPGKTLKKRMRQLLAKKERQHILFNNIVANYVIAMILHIITYDVD